MPLKSKQPRLDPLDPPYAPDAAAALDALGPPIQLFRVLARRPALAAGLASWGRYYLGGESALTRRHRELVIIRTTALCHAEYEWRVHLGFFADQAGLTPAQVASLTDDGGSTNASWSEADAAVLHAVDALHACADLDDVSWTSLTSAVGEDGALDVVLICGWYHAISYLVNSLRLTYDPALDGKPAT